MHTESSATLRHVALLERTRTRARNVEVCPLHAVLDELLQEGCTRRGPSTAALDGNVLNVRLRALQICTVLFEQRQLRAGVSIVR